MKRQFIYARTTAGQQALERGAAGPEPRHRRFLALVDGQRTIGELQTVSRPDELIRTLEDLLGFGLIEKVGEKRFLMPGVEVSDTDPFAAAAMTPEMFVRIKRRAISDLDKRVGSAGAAVAQRLDACVTPAELRNALRAAEPDLAPLMGEGAALEFLQGIGRNLVA